VLYNNVRLFLYVFFTNRIEYSRDEIVDAVQRQYRTNYILDVFILARSLCNLNEFDLLNANTQNPVGVIVWVQAVVVHYLY
jgi:hypothetical protein